MSMRFECREVAPEYNTVREVAFSQLNDMLSKFEDTEWLKFRPSWPGFDDFVFRFGSQVYSVVLAWVMEEKNGDSVNLRCDEYLCDLQAQIGHAAQNGLIPCEFPYDFQNKCPYHDKWNLFSSVTTQPVQPELLRDDIAREMSDWELNNRAVAKMIQFLEDTGQKVTALIDAFEFGPQVEFLDTDGKKAWVYVSFGKSLDEIPDFDASKLNEWPNVKQYNGYYAHAVFANLTDGENRLLRGCPLMTNLIGFRKVHEAE